MHVTNLLPKLLYITLQCLLVDAAVQIFLMHSVTSAENMRSNTKEKTSRILSSNHILHILIKSLVTRISLGHLTSNVPSKLRGRAVASTPLRSYHNALRSLHDKERREILNTNE